MDLRLSLIPSRNVVVSGSTGFVGRTLLFDFRNEVRRLENLDLIPSGCVLIHLAAQVTGDGENLIANNFDVDLAAAGAAASRLAGVVYASTNNVYPLHAQEGVAYAPGAVGPYAASKRIGEALVQALARCPWWIARFGDVFGYGQAHGNFFRAAEQSIRENNPIRLFGSGSKVRNYVYAPDLAGALLHMAEKLHSQTVQSEVSNLCYPESMTIAKIANQLAKIASVPVQSVAISNDGSAADFRTMTSGPLHGFHWRWSMEEALADYVRTIKNGTHTR